MLRRLAPGGSPRLAHHLRWLALWLVCWGCASKRALQGLHAIPVEAQQAMARALQGQEDGQPADSPELWRELRRARELAPDWIAAARLEDDLLSQQLRSVEALERRRVALRRSPRDASALYLVARLEGKRDLQTWGRVVRAEPRSAWAQHAFAWANSLVGRNTAASAAWRRAIALARSPSDRVYFIERFATYLVSKRKPREALELLHSYSAAASLGEQQQARVRTRLALLELNSASAEQQRRGYIRALALIAAPQLSQAALQQLLPQMLDHYSSDDPNLARLERALLSLDTSMRRKWLITLWLRRGAGDYARGLMAHSADPELANLMDVSYSFAGQLRQRDPIQAVADWLESMPEQVLDGDGLPRDEKLRAMVAAAYATKATDFSLDSLLSFANSLLAVGWYAEAHAMADWIVSQDFELGFDLRREAQAGQALFQRLARLLRDVEQDRNDVEILDAAGLTPAADSASLDDLLRRFGLAFGQARADVMGAQEGNEVRELFATSPRLDFGLLAQLVHPGPLYSAKDEREGRGLAGSPVPGLAAAMAERGRFAIVGQALGAGGPDAMVLRRVLVEQREGQHLGVAWQGSVAWCDGVDVFSRAARGDDKIAGAALHEGYWIDLAALRPVYKRWQSLRESFDGPATDEHAQARLERAIGGAGLRLQTSKSQPLARSRERQSLQPVLGEALRLQLVLMRERAPQDRLLGDIPFEQLVELTATHEEGHLCDQTRFLPIFHGLPALFMFALDQGFSPTAIRERLEYRAELTALCEIPDPRLSLVNLLEASTAVRDSGLGHGPAYRQLLRDLLGRLDRHLQRDPGAWPELSADHTLLHQLHRLGPEKLRQLALEAARAEGLLRGKQRPAN